MSKRIIGFEHSSLFGVADLEDPTAYARAELHAMLSGYLRGEQFAVRSAQRACEEYPEAYCRELVKEESEHVALFESYLLEEYGEIAELELSYQEMLDAADQMPAPLALLTLHTVIEPFGLGALSAIVRNIESERLKALVERVIADETRHVQLPGLHPEFFLKTITAAPAFVASWLDECVIAMSTASCPTKTYEKYLNQAALVHARSSASRSNALARQSRSVFSVLSRARRSLPRLVQHLKPLNDLMGKRYQPGAFTRLAASHG